jgi:peptide/nickel transport system substrate-binding protein
VGQRISDEAYAPFTVAISLVSVVRQGVHGPGLDTPIPPVVGITGIAWDEVWMTPG